MWNKHLTLAFVAVALLATAPAAASGDPDGSPATDPETSDAQKSGEGASSTTDAPAAKADGKVEGSAKKPAANSQSTAAVAGGLAPQSAWPVGMQASITQSVGQGTFIPYKRWNPNVTTQLSLTPQIRMFGVTLFASETLNIEWTQPDSRSGQRITLLGDPNLGAFYRFSISPIWLTLQVSGGVRLGLTNVSIATGVLGGVFGGVNAFWSTPIGVSLFASTRLQGNVAIPQARGFFGVLTNNEQPTLLESGELVNVGNCLARAGEDPVHVCSAIPSIAQGSASAGISYSIWRVTLSASLGGLGFIPAYWGPNDQYTSPNAFVGAYPSALTFGSLDATINVYGPWYASLGTSSFQPLLTSDGKWPRFPMWDFISPASNWSSLYASTSVAF